MSKICEWPTCMTRQEQVDAQSAAYAKANCQTYALVADALLDKIEVDDTIPGKEKDLMAAADSSKTELANAIKAMSAERFPHSGTQAWLTMLLTEHGTWAGRKTDFMKLLDMGDAEEMRFKTSIAMILAGEARIHSRVKVTSWILSLGLGDDWIKENTERYDRLRAACSEIDEPPAMPTRSAPRAPHPEPPGAMVRPIARRPLPPPIPTAPPIPSGSSVETPPGPATPRPLTPTNTSKVPTNEDPAQEVGGEKKRGTKFGRMRMAAKDLFNVKGKKGNN